jgi:low affinity Fe/Cu permease
VQFGHPRLEFVLEFGLQELEPEYLRVDHDGMIAPTGGSCPVHELVGVDCLLGQGPDGLLRDLAIPLLHGRMLAWEDDGHTASVAGVRRRLTGPERSTKGMTQSKVERTNDGGLATFFTSFATWISKWTGSHWALVVAAVLVILCLFVTDVETTNLAIAIVTLLMVFVLQNTQNRDSAALHLKLDEMVRAEPHARDEIRGVESKSHEEIGELVREDTDTLAYPSAEGAQQEPRP